MEKRKFVFLISLISFVITLFITILLYIKIRDKSFEFQIVKCLVVDVKTEYINNYKHTGGRFETTVKVKYNNKFYELLNDHNESYKYVEGSSIDAYLSEGKLYANKEGIISNLKISKIYYIFLFLTMLTFTILLIFLIYYKRERKRKLELKKGNNFIEDSSEKIADIREFNERDRLAIDVARNIYSLYNELKEIEPQQKYLILRIKDVDISKTCRLNNIEEFIQKIREKRTIIGYELSVSYIGNNTVTVNNDKNKIVEEHINKNKIMVTISNENIVNLDYEYDILDGIFDVALEKIARIVEEKYKKTIQLNLLKKEITIKEFVDFGILGEYNLDYIRYEPQEKLSEEQKNIAKKKIIDNYIQNIDEINKKIFFEIYLQLSRTDYNIWETQTFEKIIDIDKLPTDFYNVSDNEKRDILYNLGKNYSYEELWQKIQEEKTFWNLNNIKNDVNLIDIVIEEEYKRIHIQFKGIFDFFIAHISLDYMDNYKIVDFNPN